MSISSTANLINSISRYLGVDGNSSINNAERLKDELTRKAKEIAKREFMYKLRGENDIIDLESVQTIRDRGAIELAKSA